jgi:NADPH:quinone reductase-like Zn-dependent oxidoreductase
MKAIVFTEYGPPDVLQYREIDKPEPAESEVLVKVSASSVNAYDWHMLRADPFLVRLMNGLFKPRIQILGADIAGVVEAVGCEVTRFKAGDQVYGDISALGGGFAEFVCADESFLAFKPASLSFAESASLPMASVTALQGLRDHGKIKSGQKVAINGASGGVGSCAIQIAKAFEGEVTAICSTRNMEAARDLGADHVIDYTREDFTKSGNKYDLIFAVNGNSSIFDYRRALKPGGRFVQSGGSMKQVYQAMILGPILSKKNGRKMKNYIARPNSKDLEFIAELVQNGKLKPVIDKKYELNEVPEAIRYLEDGHARGKIVITIADRFKENL